MKIPAPRCRFSVLLAAMLLVSAVPASAIDGAADKVKDGEPQAAPAEKIAYKFTPSYYHTTNVTPAYDLNLRGNLGAQTAWIGFYQRSNEFQQLRLGYENTLELPFGRVTPSMQYATRGFLGGSLTGEIGERYFALAGFGRTNLKDYFNLNFDPNDMVLLSFGTRAAEYDALAVPDPRRSSWHRPAHLASRWALQAG